MVREEELDQRNRPCTASPGSSIVASVPRSQSCSPSPGADTITTALASPSIGENSIRREGRPRRARVGENRSQRRPPDRSSRRLAAAGATRDRTGLDRDHAAPTPQTNQSKFMRLTRGLPSLTPIAGGTPAYPLRRLRQAKRNAVKTIHHVFEIAAPREDVYVALTTSEGLASWWTTLRIAELPGGAGMANDRARSRFMTLHDVRFPGESDGYRPGARRSAARLSLTSAAPDRGGGGAAAETGWRAQAIPCV
jgi:hypothetical protein